MANTKKSDPRKMAMLLMLFTFISGYTVASLTGNNPTRVGFMSMCLLLLFEWFEIFK